MTYAETADLMVALKEGGKGALTGFGLGTITGGVSGYKYALKNDLNPWNGKSLIDAGYYPEGHINISRENIDIGQPNSVRHYTDSKGKPISDYFYDSKGKIEFEIDYKPHNMGYPHGHKMTIPGNIESGHLPQNHVPFILIPKKYWLKLKN